MGEEPDARFSMANERTALAWVRTSLGLIAGGVALTSFATIADLSTFLDLVASIACFAGAGFAIYALITWWRNERALRLKHPLPAPAGLPLLVVVVLVLALLLAVYAGAHTVG